MDAGYTDAEHKVVTAMEAADIEILNRMTKTEAKVASSAFAEAAPDDASKRQVFADLARMTDYESLALAKLDGAKTRAVTEMADFKAVLVNKTDAATAEAVAEISGADQKLLAKVQEAMPDTVAVSEKERIAKHCSPIHFPGFHIDEPLMETLAEYFDKVC